MRAVSKALPLLLKRSLATKTEAELVAFGKQHIARGPIIRYADPMHCRLSPRNDAASDDRTPNPYHQP